MLAPNPMDNPNLAMVMASLFGPPQEPTNTPTAEEVEATIARVNDLPINFTPIIDPTDEEIAAIKGRLPEDSPWLFEEGIIALDVLRYRLDAAKAYLDFKQYEEAQTVGDFTYELARKAHLKSEQVNNLLGLRHKLTVAVNERAMRALDLFNEQNPTWFEETTARWKKEAEEREAQMKELRLQVFGDEAEDDVPLVS